MAIAVPVDVVLVGFSPEFGASLQDVLVPLEVVRHYRESVTLPMVPTAVYRVQVLPESLSQEFEDSLRPAPERSEQLDGNLAEESLQAILARAGYNLSRDLPALVFVHLGDDRVGDHGYLYRGENDWALNAVAGWVENARVFGAKAPVLVMDVSAREDLDANYPSAGRDFEKPMRLDDTRLGDALRVAVHEATLGRLFPGIGWETSTATCNAFTLLIGIRAAALGGQAPSTFDLLIRAERLAASLSQVSGKPSFMDVKTLLLPVDDPTLDALARAESAESTAFFAGGVSSAPVETWPVSNQVHAAMNTWVDQNWDKYHVDHLGCEEVLGIFIWGDLADYPFNRGFAMHPSLATHRWMMAGSGVLMQADGPTYVPFTGRGENTGTDQFAESVIAHEFGHTLGLHHPHHKPSAPGSAPSDDWAFAKAANILSFAWSGRTVTFGALDGATLVRNEAGFAIKAAHDLAVLETPAGAAALEALRRWDWQGATQALRPSLA